jgi:outer membrane protein TolC
VVYLLIFVTGPGCHSIYQVGQPPPVEQEAYIQQSLRNISYQIPESMDEVTSLPAGPPELGTREADEPWPLLLFNAIQMALHNSEIMRQDAQFLAASNPLHVNPEAVASSLDPEIQDSNINFGNRGMTGALSDFAPRLSGNLLFGRDERIQNNLFLEGLAPGDVLTDESTNFLLRLDKQLAWGGQVAVDHVIDYSENNSPARLFPSQYVGGLNFIYSQPLWAGAGTEFTQIAGPMALLNPRIVGVNQGVLISRIHGEVAQLDFEERINQLVKDVTDVYWDLAQARQNLLVEQETLERLKQIWDSQQAELEAGRTSNANEAEAAEAVYAAEGRIEQAWAQVNTAELRLRRLIGLPARDGRAIDPIDEPLTDLRAPRYLESLTTALGRRPELRRTKWHLRSLQLQRKAARSLVNPNLDLRAGYRLNGFGDDPFGSARNDGFYGNLFSGGQTGWDLGVVFTMPLGFPQERALLRHIELRLLKARMAVAAQEAEISYELTNAHDAAQRWERIISLFSRRRDAARRRLDSVEAEYEADRTTLSNLIEARLSHARAETEYQRSLAEYTKALSEVHFRQGSLLELQQLSVQHEIQDVLPEMWLEPPDEAADDPEPAARIELTDPGDAVVGPEFDTDEPGVVFSLE